MSIFAPARVDCVDENIYDVWGAKNHVHDDHNRGGYGIFRQLPQSIR